MEFIPDLLHDGSDVLLVDTADLDADAADASQAIESYESGANFPGDIPFGD